MDNSFNPKTSSEIYDFEGRLAREHECREIIFNFDSQRRRIEEDNNEEIENNNSNVPIQYYGSFPENQQANHNI